MVAGNMRDLRSAKYAYRGVSGVPFASYLDERLGCARWRSFSYLGPETVNCRDGLRQLLCSLNAFYWVEVTVEYSYAALRGLDYHEYVYSPGMALLEEQACVGTSC